MIKDKFIVGLSGASHTGKTTVAKMLIKKFNLYDNTDFVIKHFIPYYGKPTNDPLNQLRVTLTWGDVVDSCNVPQVIDRTPLDHLVYARMFKSMHPKLTEVAWFNLDKIDLLIILPAVVWVDDNKKYSDNKKVQSRFQKQLEWFLKDHDSTYCGWISRRGFLRNAYHQVLYTIPKKNSSIKEILKFVEYEVNNYNIEK